MPEDGQVNPEIQKLEADAEDLLRSLHPEVAATSEPHARSTSVHLGLSRPFVIEFAGTPKAGKTTAFENLVMFLRRNDFRVASISEKAASCPIKQKDHIFFNTWTASQTLSDLLVALQGSYDVVVLDRGLFDALIWMRWLRNKGRLSPHDYDVVTSFYQIERWKSVIDLVFLLTVDPTTALEREHSRFLTHKPGTIMNETALAELNQAIVETYDGYRDQFRKIERYETIETKADQGTADIVRKVLSDLRRFLDEKVLAIPRKVFHKLDPKPRFEGSEHKVKALLRAINLEKRYVSRVDAESNFDLVQPIVICVIRYHDELFVVRKKERDPRNRMHGKYAVWVGGHVRDADDAPESGTLLHRAMVRELDEEVQVNVNGGARLIGYVWDHTNDKSQIHCGVVYELAVSNKDLKLALTQKEFTERRGHSISGSFQPLNKITDLAGELELWSHYVLRDHYGVNSLQNLSVQHALFTT